MKKNKNYIYQMENIICLMMNLKNIKSNCKIINMLFNIQINMMLLMIILLKTNTYK